MERYIPEGIDKFVDNFFNEEINNYIKSQIGPDGDPRAVMMFINIYYALCLKIPESQNKKRIVKEYLSEIMSDTNLRHKMVQSFNRFFGSDEIKILSSSEPQKLLKEK